MTGYDSDGVDLTGGGMDPDHPLLARAQAALRKQLEDRKRDVEERIREKEAELNVRPRPRPVPPARLIPEARIHSSLELVPI